jgi:D-proline reductase (dithiol) PrdB
MGNYDEFSLPIRLFLKAYPWRRIEPVPFAPLGKPLSACRLALVTSAGFTLAGQPPFDKSVRGGDWSFREIPHGTPPGQLMDFHKSESFDHSGMRQDSNLALPQCRANELVQSGRIGSVNARHLSFMGSITAPGRLIRDSAPEAARILARDQVQVALLVPV